MNLDRIFLLCLTLVALPVTAWSQDDDGEGYLTRLLQELAAVICHASTIGNATDENVLSCQLHRIHIQVSFELPGSHRTGKIE